MKEFTTRITFFISSSLAVEWPFGTYTLVKPKSGCPANWMEGWRFQDNEDSRSDNGIPYDYHFAGTNAS